MPGVEDGGFEVGLLHGAGHANAVGGLRLDDGLEAGEAIGYLHDVVCGGLALLGRSIEVGKVRSGAVVELLQRGGCACVAVRHRLEEWVLQGILSLAHAAVGNEEDLFHTIDFALVGAPKVIQAFLSFPLHRPGTSGDDGHRTALEGPLLAIFLDNREALLAWIVCTEAFDNVAVEVGAGGCIGQIRGFAEEGSQQVTRLELRRGRHVHGVVDGQPTK